MAFALVSIIVIEPVAPLGPVGPVGPQIVEDLIADHGPYCDGENGGPDPYIARIRKKYWVVGASPVT
jgi:hypothetical protein